MSFFHLNNIYLQNFRSIKKATFEIKPGLYSIEGLNLDQMSSANGAGKTSLISGLWWCLTGSSLNNETLADEVINLSSGKDCRVECNFTTDNGDLKIIRTRKDSEHGNNLFLYVNNQDLSCHKIADTQDRINQIFKVNWELLKSTIIMTSDMKSCFSSLTPQNRIALLESVRDYSIWNKVRDESNKDIKEYDSQIKQNSSEINILQGTINTYIKLVEDNTNTLNNIKVTFNEQEINTEIENINNKIKEIENDILIVSSSLNNNNEELDNNIEELKKKQQEIIKTGNDLNSSIQNILFEIKNINYDIDIINKWFKDDTCPTCGRKLERSNIDISSKTNKKIELETKINELNKNKQNIEEKIQIERNNYSVLDIELQKLNQEKAEIHNKNKENSNKLISLNKLLSDYKINKTELENKLKEHDSKLETLQNTINDYKIEIQNKENDKIILEVKNKELEDDKEISKFFYDVLGPKGAFRPSLLRKDILYLNKCIDRYTQRFFDNTEISLSTPDNENNKIDIIVKQGKLIKPVSSLSGGETKRLNLCIQLGIYDLIKSTCLIDFNFVCFDEIESQIDEQGIRSLVDIIEERKDYISSILWITNNPTVSGSIMNKIICKKSFGFTEIDYKDL